MKLTKKHYLKIIASFKRNKHAFINNLIEVKGLLRDLNNILSKKEYDEIISILDKYPKLKDEILYIELSLTFLKELMDYLAKNNPLFRASDFYDTFCKDVIEVKQ